MSVVISGIEKGSAAEKAGILPGDTLISLSGNEIEDVLDYRFYQNESRLTVLIRRGEKELSFKIKKGEYDETGMLFETYLMDKQHSCRNNCIFCFIDQLPKGLRSSLYFKDDDSRMSFLFGNYITLTNITEHEVDRVIKMHISPVNVSVHTTNPELRCKMMNNRFAGRSLEILRKICEAGIAVNCQLVLIPGMNDGKELERSLCDLIKYPSVKSIAAVPVGITKYREGLPKLTPFNESTAGKAVDILEAYGEKTVELYGERRVFASDEFYITANRPMPDAGFYGDFPQIENGVGMCAALRSECEEALFEAEDTICDRDISLVTGEAAYPLIRNIVDNAGNKWHNLKCRVFLIKNDFFGGEITVTGLVTATDIIKNLKGRDIGDELLVPSVMLRAEGDMFLDSVTVPELEKALGIKVRTVDGDGWSLISALTGNG